MSDRYDCCGAEVGTSHEQECDVPFLTPIIPPPPTTAAEWADWVWSRLHTPGPVAADVVSLVILKEALTTHARQQVEAFRARAAPRLDTIQRKCEQYWNENGLGDEEVHAILDLIFQEAAAIRALERKPPAPR